MMVIFVSQCEKKALLRTRRVLDAFADRIGDNTWQTVITQDGLKAVQSLLRKTASKNTAVSCHWIRTRERTDLLWVIGKRNKFDFKGVVPVNRTSRNLLHGDWENNWQYASSIQIVATLAALLHDIGKSTIGFQEKLTTAHKGADPYRHEWISLKLFELLIKDCETDQQWLSRFASIDQELPNIDLPAALELDSVEHTNIAIMPPLAQWIAWLIVSHHRLPPYKKVHYKLSEKERFKRSQRSVRLSINSYYTKQLRAIDYWVKNPKSFECKNSEDHVERFWSFDDLVIHSPVWQKHIKRWATKALNDPALTHIVEDATAHNDEPHKPISDTFLLYLSRLCLMVADHNYSSLQSADTRRLRGATSFRHLAANTLRTSHQDATFQTTDNKSRINQTLDEHLIGVGAFSAAFARKLPVIANSLPSLKQHDTLSTHTSISRFAWQNKAYDLARSLQESTEDHGFFGVNMASTGCGKTIANARIMYGLADLDKGARFTIALGLRILTLQTGQSFRRDLQLTSQQLAILVGGQANRQLFEIGSEDDIIEEKPAMQSFTTFGSESSEDLIDEWVDSEIDISQYDELNLGTVIESAKARDLLFSPIVTCTVDHLIQASECKRGGKYIAPMLRLLSSDLILDEPDDFDKADLPALSRLVHIAGLLGSRVLLSSATLTPDLVTGLFKAYHAGRTLFNNSQKKPKANVVCAWFDEQPKAMIAGQCTDQSTFLNLHQKFIQKRTQFLSKQTIRRSADILPLALYSPRTSKDSFFEKLGQEIINHSVALHQHHHQRDQQSDKSVSIGLVRFAYIKNIHEVIMRLFDNGEVPEDTHIHVACYHSRQLLILRNSLEKKLDRILRRDEQQPEALLNHPEIKAALGLSNARHHVFIVMATPVAEVGRDHDYDWAIVEPSSMRSIIQLAGRVWRHRPTKVAKKTNMRILQYNLRYLIDGSSKPVFTHPGFEDDSNRLDSYDAQELIPDSQRQQIDARPRISSPRYNRVETLSDLEHQSMQQMLNNDTLNYVNAYWDTQATANKVHTHLQQISPFREGRKHDDYLIIPNTDNEYGYDAYLAEAVYSHSLSESPTCNQRIQPHQQQFNHTSISPWLSTSLNDALDDIQAKMPDHKLRTLAVRFATVSLQERDSWHFSEYLGFL